MEHTMLLSRDALLLQGGFAINHHFNDTYVLFLFPFFLFNDFLSLDICSAFVIYRRSAVLVLVVATWILFLITLYV
jgi:hypothetical protein